MKFVKVDVEALSGYKVNERPLAFTHEGLRREVVKVVDQWLEGGLSPKDQAIDYFKVEADDGRQYILRYLSTFDVWSLMVEPSGT
jgi:hypothetical protein